MKRLTIALPAAMSLVCGTYTIVYLVRWEWNRAIIAGLFFVAVEVVVATLLVVERLRRIEQRLAERVPAEAAAVTDPTLPTPRALAAIRDAAPPPPDRFAWVRDQAGRTNVFLPVLLGAGVLASALAWAVEHVARATLTPARERRLAASLDPIALPRGGLLAAPAPVHRPGPRRLGAVLGTAVGAVAVVGAVLGTVAAIDFVADRTQTRPDAYVAGATTRLELQLLGATATGDPHRIVGHLWATCTGPDVFRFRTLPVPDLDHRDGGRVAVHVQAHIGDHALARLRGCLNDTTLDRVQARVLAAGSSR